MRPPGAERAPLGFPAKLRLRRAGDFEAVYAGGRRCADRFFTVTARASGKGHPRLGMAVSLKAMGSAVARNRLRRLVRESFRLHQHELPPLDIVVGARAQARTANAAQLRESLEGLWRKLAKSCARPSGS